MKESKFKELLTEEFLSTLKIAVEYCNWSVDKIETMRFCDWCHDIVGVTPPNYDDVDFQKENEINQNQSQDEHLKSYNADYIKHDMEPNVFSEFKL